MYGAGDVRVVRVPQVQGTLVPIPVGDARPVRLLDGARFPTADALRILGNWTTDQESAATPSAASPADC
jgi:hypothetical protein